MAPSHIGELTDRMREIFGLVVEAYLERGMPVGLEGAPGYDQPVARLDPRRDAGTGGARAAHPSAHFRRAHPDRKRACDCSSTGSCRSPGPIRARGARSSARSSATSRSKTRSRRPRRRCRGFRQAAGRGARPEARNAAEAAQFRPAQPRRVRWRCWSAPMAASRTVSSRSTAATSAAALNEVSNFINARLAGLTLAEAETRLRAEIRDRKEADRRRGRRAGRFGPRRMEPGSRASSGADRPRSCEPARCRRGG